MSASHMVDLLPNIGYRSAETPKDLSRWRSNKEALYDLYIRQKQTLVQVKATMESYYGFPTTLRLCDYERVLREVFKFRKNLSADDWKLSIGPRIATRQAAGKRSEVLLNDSRVENVDRRVRRSLQSRSSRRCAKAHTAALPYGVIIRTPPASPKLSALASCISFGPDPEASGMEQCERLQSFSEFLEGYEDELRRLRSLVDVVPLPGASLGRELLSAEPMREGCPIDEILTMLNQYHHSFNPENFRLFGPNATSSVLGKICFDFSNNLQDESMSQYDMTRVLDWIGFHADRIFLRTFFAEKSLTLLATWEALNRTAIDRKHAAALDTLVSVHLVIRDTAPWVGGMSRRLLDYLVLVPNLGSALIGAFPCAQNVLDNGLWAAISENVPMEVVNLLISAGASLRHKYYCSNVDVLIRYFGSQECQVVDFALLKELLEIGAVVDNPLPHGDPDLGWPSPNRPLYATDFLLLSRGQSTHNLNLWLLVSSYGNRQQTTVTVPGIFEASRGGNEQLRSYLNARWNPREDHDRMMVLEVALSEASGRGDAGVLQTLMRFGVDPNVRMLPKYPIIWNKRGFRENSTWHPVIRAANAGNVDVLQILVSAPDIDVSLIDEQLLWLDYFDPCPLRKMESSKLDQVLRLLSTLKFSAQTRTDILVHALGPRNYNSGHYDPDLGLVKALINLGLASADHWQNQWDGDIPLDHLLVRALRAGCGFRALNYLVEQDTRILNASSATIEELFAIIAWDRGPSETHAILQFLAQKVKGFMTYVQEKKPVLLRQITKYRQSHEECYYDAMGYGEIECGLVITAKWLMGLGATLDINGFTNLIPHADEGTMLATIDSVADINAVDKSRAQRMAITFGRFNLARALIERGVQTKGPRLVGAYCEQSILQDACHKLAPLWFIRYLVDKGADINGDPRRVLTALQFAAGSGSMNVVQLLLNCGADVNTLSEKLYIGRSKFVRAIDVAARRSRLDMVHFLIKAGARSGRPGLTGLDGAIEAATETGHSAIADLLQKHIDSDRGERMEAEGRWLQANPHVYMDNGEIKAKVKSPDG